MMMAIMKIATRDGTRDAADARDADKTELLRFLFFFLIDFE